MTYSCAANAALIEDGQLRAEVAAMRTDNNKGHAATAANTGKISTNVDAVVRKGGGSSFSTKEAA